MADAWLTRPLRVASLDLLQFWKRTEPVFRLMLECEVDE